ncbi:MAG: hypothetical protein RLZZ50_907, partial [Verrucomicrobiota bacterium]
GENDCQLLFTPAIDRDVHGLFLGQIGAVEPDALHLVIADQAGFHLPEGDPRIPQTIRPPSATASTPPCPDSNATFRPPPASGRDGPRQVTPGRGAGMLPGPASGRGRPG